MKKYLNTILVVLAFAFYLISIDLIMKGKTYYDILMFALICTFLFLYRRNKEKIEEANKKKEGDK